jgi:hypothetical protein
MSAVGCIQAETLMQFYQTKKLSFAALIFIAGLFVETTIAKAEILTLNCDGTIFIIDLLAGTGKTSAIDGNPNLIEVKISEGTISFTHSGAPAWNEDYKIDRISGRLEGYRYFTDPGLRAVNRPHNWTSQCAKIPNRAF